MIEGHVHTMHVALKRIAKSGLKGAIDSDEYMLECYLRMRVHDRHKLLLADLQFKLIEENFQIFFVFVNLSWFPKISIPRKVMLEKNGTNNFFKLELPGFF